METNKTKPAFDPLAEAYEAMVDWPKRLAGEEPFYRWLFERFGAASVLDAACGTGHHAAMFHAWGLRVEGADISPAMIEGCRRRFGEPPGLRWVVRGYDQPVAAAEPFDVVICTGNSLALATDRGTIERAIGRLLAAVRPGGAVLVQVVNLWRMADGPCQWQKCTRATLSQGDSLIVKGLHRGGDRGYVDVVVANLAGSPSTMRTESVPFWGLEAGDVERMARAAGASAVEIYGDYGRHPYDRPASGDLVVLITRTTKTA